VNEKIEREREREREKGGARRMGHLASGHLAAPRKKEKKKSLCIR
jgi:hypothetical protein